MNICSVKRSPNAVPTFKVGIFGREMDGGGKDRQEREGQEKKKSQPIQQQKLLRGSITVKNLKMGYNLSLLYLTISIAIYFNCKLNRYNYFTL